MAKGDDALRRKKNKVIRKRMRADNANKVSARVAAIIASKQRRKAGKRRMCEGMCFSLPSPDDPFNDKHNQKNSVKKNDQKSAALQTDAGASVTRKDAKPRKDISGRQRDPQKGKPMKLGKDRLNVKQCRGIHGGSDGPSKFFTMCLATIQRALLEKNILSGSEHSLFLSKWGAEFLACSLLGTDILDTTGASSSVEQIAWMVSIAADVMTLKDKDSEKDGSSVPNPFLLILVPSKEKAIQVRTTCKPLKALGIHTVSLHSEASLDHQIQGLQSCEPEFLISTPERLLELISMKVVDISGLPFLVIDGLDSFVRGGLLDQLKSIKQSILKSFLKVVLCDNFGIGSTSAVQMLMDKPITRLSLTDSVASQSACITQYVHMCASQEKTSKAMEILNEECRKQLASDHLKVLFVVEKSSNASDTISLLIAEGYSKSRDASPDCLEATYSKGKVIVTVTAPENIESRADMGEFEIVVITSFPPEIDDYTSILTGMARKSVNGVLHTCFSEEDAPMAGSLIEILEQCSQNVPEFLKDYHGSHSMSEH